MVVKELQKTIRAKTSLNVWYMQKSSKLWFRDLACTEVMDQTSEIVRVLNDKVRTMSYVVGYDFEYICTYNGVLRTMRLRASTQQEAIKEFLQIGGTGDCFKSCSAVYN